MGAVSRKNSCVLDTRACPALDLCLLVTNGLFDIPLGEFDASEEIFREFLINSPPVTPRVCSIIVIKKLIEAGNLSRFKGLVRDELSLQNPKYSGAKRRGWNWIPGNPEFRVELVFALEFRAVAVREIPASPECKCRISQEVDIGIRVNVGMFKIRTSSR